MKAAERAALDLLAAGATVLLSIHLDASTLQGGAPEFHSARALRGEPHGTFPTPGALASAWADGLDAEGRPVLLIGRHALEQTEPGRQYVIEVLAALAGGTVPPGVHAIAYAPKASAAFVEIVAGASHEVLVDGPRGTGKTQMSPAALAALAEFHLRAGFAGPLRALWVHDALLSASVKTGRSLEAPLWGGLWALRDDRKVAVLTLAGVELVRADFVGVQDPSAAERLKAEAHVVLVEEAVPSLSEGGGVSERDFELALTSCRLPTRRRVGVVVTNPGAPDSWPALRFGLEGAVGKPGSVRRQIPASDRLTTEEQAALLDAFRDSPDLTLRLARGEWAELKLGEAVTPGFRDAHIAPDRLRPVRNVPLWIGWDGGHTPTAVIGSHYQGGVLIYAALPSTRSGTRQHIEQTVRPWLGLYAPWVLGAPSLLQHRVDPAMATGEQADIDQDPVRVIRELLGGTVREGAVAWPARLEPVTALLGRFNGYSGTPTLQIDPVDGLPLIRALRGRWYFPTVHGVVSRDLPVKNHPWSDLGDSLAYLVGGLAPSREPRDPSTLQRYAVSATTDVLGEHRRAMPPARSRTAHW